MPKHLANIEKLIQLYGKNGHSVGDSLTWADLFVFDFASSHTKSIDGFAAKFPGVTQVMQLVENNPKIAAYVKTRPETKF